LAATSTTSIINRPIENLMGKCSGEVGPGSNLAPEIGRRK
jgi:hypothetical protein